MSEQIIDAAMARALHADACRDHALVGWIVMKDPPDQPGKFTARLAANRPSAYVLIGDTLAEVQEQLPSGLVRSERQTVDPLKVVEVWFADTQQLVAPGPMLSACSWSQTPMPMRFAPPLKKKANYLPPLSCAGGFRDQRQGPASARSIVGWKSPAISSSVTLLRPGNA